MSLAEQYLKAAQESPFLVIKYNYNNSKSAARYICISRDCTKLTWGTRESKLKEFVFLKDVTRVVLGLRSQNLKRHNSIKQIAEPWNCFAVFLSFGRTLDLCAESALAARTFVMALQFLVKQRFPGIIQHVGFQLRARCEMEVVFLK